MLNKGDEISVRVVEVDKERGRIGLRLAEDPEIAGKTKEELGRRRRMAAAGATAATARAATAAARAATATAGRAVTAIPTGASPLPEHQLTRSTGAAGRHGAHELRAIRGLRFFIGAGSRGELAEEAGCRTSSSTCCSAAPTGSRRPRSTSCSTAWAPS